MTSALQVLHLEDDPNDVELIRSMLQAEGMACDVQRVEGHDDFVEALERGGFVRHYPRRLQPARV